MKRKVLAFIFDGYADWESAYICAELNGPETGYEVRTISLDRKPKVSMGGFKVMPDYSVGDFPEDFALLVLIGGVAWVEGKNDAVLPVVDYAVRHGIPVGAICNAVCFMAEHGYLDNIKHSGNTLEFIKSHAPHYRGERNFIEKQAVCDSGIITANGSATLEFTREIALLLKAKPENVVSEEYRFGKFGFYKD
jgi:putative intracellular protease/amidase